MSRKLIMLAAILLGITAFVWADIQAGLRVVAMTGPNSVMHSKALPNDGAIHQPYLPWSGTADSAVVYAGQTVIKKGDVLGGMWGGRRASSTQRGELLVTLTSINGQNAAAHYHQEGSANGQDTWVSAGADIPFITCTSLSFPCPGADVPANLRVVAMSGPNSVMHSKALPNDGAIHQPYLPWSGTADSAVVYAGQTVIKKGDVLGGMWGGRRGSSTQPGQLLITLTSINGGNAAAHFHQEARGNGQDTWVAAGADVPFITCTSLSVPCLWTARIFP